jgi:rhodanese-related sulfurtransferase
MFVATLRQASEPSTLPVNFRDVGHVPSQLGGLVQPGVVFRSDTLHLTHLRELELLVAAHGITTVVDLRSSVELATAGIGHVGSLPLTHHHLPIVDEPTQWLRAVAEGATIADLTIALLHTGAAQIVEALNVVADADGPVVVHCTAGKDRTGVVAALLLALVDVPRSAIVADYARTAESLPVLIARLVGDASHHDDHFDRVVAEVMSAHPATMEAFLTYLNSSLGGAESWVLHHGMNRRSLNQLRSRLLGRRDYRKDPQ